MDADIVPQSFNDEQKLYLKEIIGGIFGDPIILEADATTAAGELRNPNDIGFNPTNRKLFANINGSTYLIATLTLV